MPKLITDPANSDYAFGQDFNYAVWTEGTNVTLCNVPWNNDYRDIVSFPTPLGLSLDQYIDSNNPENTVIEDVSYLKFNVPITINIPFNKAFKYNYLRVQNPEQPIPGTDVLKSYYYFILDCKYLAPNATQLTIQLDIFQSFVDDFEFGNSYIERGHIGIANQNSFQNYGRDYLTIPEGLDTGGEYQVVTKRDEQVAKSQANPTDPNSILFDILMITTVDLASDPGTVAAPNLVTAKGSFVQSNVPEGAAFWVFSDYAAFFAFMQNTADKPWITQGIISITIIPSIIRYSPSFTYNPTVAPLWGATPINGNLLPIKHQLYSNWRNSNEILGNIPARYRHLTKLLTYPYTVIEMTTYNGSPVIIKPESWADDDATIIERISIAPPSQRVSFTPFRHNSRTKIFNNVTVNDASNTIDTGDIHGLQLNSVVVFNNIVDVTGIVNGVPYYVYSMPTDHTFTVGDVDHDNAALNLIGNGTIGTVKADSPVDRWFIYSGLGDDGGDYMDTTASIDSFPTLAVVNNMALSYLASNANGIPFQYANASWAENRALRGNQTSYDQQNKGVQTSAGINRIQNAGVGAQAAAQNLLLAQQQAVAGIGGDITALASAGLGATNGTIGLGGVASAVGNQVIGSIQLGNQQDQNVRAANITQTVSKASNTAQNNQTQYVADTNKSLADWSAQGDYENTVAGINARVQDSKMTQPSVSGQFGGDLHNLIYENMKLSLRFKMIDQASIRTVGEYMLRYGYAVRKFGRIPSDFKVMTKFTYWKLLETYIISSSMPEGFKQIIRGIFEKGVTVWSDPDDIGQIDIADNEALGGITL